MKNYWLNIKVEFFLAYLLFFLFNSTYSLTWSPVPDLLNTECELLADSYLADTDNSVSKGLVIYIKDTSLVAHVNSNLSTLSVSSWEEPITIVENVSIDSKPLITQIGSEYEVMITWIDSLTRSLRAITFNLDTLEAGEIANLFFESSVDDYAIDSNGEKWACLVSTSTGHTIHALIGAAARTLSSELLAVGVRPNISMSPSGNAVGVFSVDGSDSTSIIKAHFTPLPSAWQTSDVYTTPILGETAQVAMEKNDAYTIAFKTEQASIHPGNTSKLRALAEVSYDKFDSLSGNFAIVSRNDEDVDSFNMLGNQNGMIGIGYRSSSSSLPKYQMTTKTLQKDGTFGSFAAPALVSNGEANIGSNAISTGAGRLSIVGYCDSENIGLNTFAYVTGNGPHAKKSSQFQNFQHSSASTIDTVLLKAGKKVGFAVWVHDSKVYGQPTQIPLGF